MKKNYGAKLRTVHNKETREMEKIWNAIIYKGYKNEIYVSSNGELLNFKTRKEAIEEAKETYEKFKGILWDKE